MLSSSEPLARQPPHQIGHCAMFSGQQHHWGMMRGGGGGKIGGIRPGDKFFYTMGLRASINHCSQCCPTATMGPHFRFLSIKQSANILWSGSTLLTLEKAIINSVYQLVFDKLSCLFVAGRDHCTAYAEHLQQQRQDIYVVYVPHHARCPWFGMSAMFRAMAAEVC